MRLLVALHACLVSCMLECPNQLVGGDSVHVWRPGLRLVVSECFFEFIVFNIFSSDFWHQEYFGWDSKIFFFHKAC